jgi:hypothetical protein
MSLGESASSTSSGETAKRNRRPEITMGILKQRQPNTISNLYGIGSYEIEVTQWTSEREMVQISSPFTALIMGHSIQKMKKSNF